ncbi:hypothetical protein MKEN_01406700 [Mycena kentingensis (nom. inval.)]|nr:hypothetical protein MKEN_01406700 [Mycena kentingensis (nom. inval.)]
MPASPTQHDWPAQTPSSGRRRRRWTDHSGSTSKMVARQSVADQKTVAKARQDCQINAGNDVVSCYPTQNTVIAQHQWVTFVWNSNLPEFTQTNRVNIYLFHGDSQEQILQFTDVVNPKGQAGYITAPVNDSWWGDRGTNWNNANISYPFFWIMSRSDKSLADGSQVPQATFTAVQTTYADSVLAAMSSTASSGSPTAPATASTTGSSLSLKSTSTAGGGNLQSGSSSNNFPHWAIAVIVVLGFLAIATTCVLAFFIIRRMRRRNLESNRNSMGSNSPMMANVGNSPASPLLAGAVIPGRLASTTSHAQGAPSVVSPDGASTISRANSAGGDGPFSGADAAIMADAFRKALRKPDFADRPVEEGESPDNPEATEDQLLSRELADEGKDIRSVGSSRGVRVETHSDAGTHDTAH